MSQDKLEKRSPKRIISTSVRCHKKSKYCKERVEEKIITESVKNKEKSGMTMLEFIEDKRDILKGIL